jgi:hypothetical protein
MKIRSCLQSLVVMLVLFCAPSYGQKRQASNIQFGIGAGFTLSKTSVSSDLAAINGMSLPQEGGAIFLNAGGDVLNLKGEFGFACSSSTVRHTVDNFSYTISLNSHLLKLIPTYASRLSPYLVTGINCNNQRFYGFYTQEERGHRNMSVSMEPYIGRIQTVSLELGAGLEYQLYRYEQFLTIFIEATTSAILQQKSKSVLQNTTIDDNITTAKIGFRFGFLKL